MATWNQWTGIGNTTREVEMRHLPSGTSIASFGIACSRKYKTAQGEEREDVLFLDCECFGKGGEVLAQYATKGKQLFLSGRLAFHQWEDKATGAKRSKVSLVVEDFQFLGSRDDQPAPRDTGSQERGGYNPPPRNRAPSSQPRQRISDAFVPAVEMPDADDESIPFRAVMPQRWV